MPETAIPDGFLRLPDAVATLAKAMYATFRQPKPLHRLKREHQKASIGFGPWKEQAAQRIRTAASNGELPLYVGGNSDQQPMLLRLDLVSGLITVRGGLPERPVRPSLRSVGGDARLLKVLSSGRLLVRQDDFVAWYNSERHKGRWPSQRLRKRPAEGRPSKVTSSLRTAVAEALGEHKRSISALHRDLIASGRTDVPSVDTLERLVDQLYRETGRPEFFRNRRRRRQ
jgi:hypothetical protein